MPGDQAIQSVTDIRRVRQWPGNVRLWHKADIPSCTAHVRFRSLLGVKRTSAVAVQCPLMTQSGHWPDDSSHPVDLNSCSQGSAGAACTGDKRMERRLAAILAADVAGYSRLMGINEEGTHQSLKAHRRELVEPKIERYRGRIIKNTGDGFLAEFMSVVDAVRCATEIQQEMALRNTEVPMISELISEWARQPTRPPPRAPQTSTSRSLRSPAPIQKPPLTTLVSCWG